MQRLAQVVVQVVRDLLALPLFRQSKLCGERPDLLGVVANTFFEHRTTRPLLRNFPAGSLVLRCCRVDRRLHVTWQHPRTLRSWKAWAAAASER